MSLTAITLWGFYHTGRIQSCGNTTLYFRLFFAALTAIFAKIGVKDINSDLATAIRTTVKLIITWGIVLFGSHFGEMKDIPRHGTLWDETLSGLQPDAVTQPEEQGMDEHDDGRLGIYDIILDKICYPRTPF